MALGIVFEIGSFDHFVDDEAGRLGYIEHKRRLIFIALAVVRRHVELRNLRTNVADRLAGLPISHLYCAPYGEAEYPLGDSRAILLPNDRRSMLSPTGL